MYDIFYVAKEDNNNINFSVLKKRFPLSKIIYYKDSKTQAVEILKKKAMTKAFWLIDTDCRVADDFNFNYVVPEWDLEYVHVWKTTNGFFDGVFLIPKKYPITTREAEYMFFINKKEIDIVASTIEVTYDVFFISYDESNADDNWELLLKKYPLAKRLTGIKGIHNAHKKAAELSTTDMFWVIDGDSVIDDDFKLDYVVQSRDKDCVFVWKSINPINGLTYGNGGIKLLPKKLLLNMSTSTVDMTTSISKKFKAMEEVSNVTRFDTDPFNTWKSAFRECVKLSSKIIDGQIDDETKERLDIWCTIGADKLYGEWAILGANLGRDYGLKYKDNSGMLYKINDWEWLRDEFNKCKLSKDSVG